MDLERQEGRGRSARNPTRDVRQWETSGDVILLHRAGVILLCFCSWGCIAPPSLVSSPVSGYGIRSVPMPVLVSEGRLRESAIQEPPWREPAPDRRWPESPRDRPARPAEDYWPSFNFRFEAGPSFLAGGAADRRGADHRESRDRDSGAQTFFQFIGAAAALKFSIDERHALAPFSRVRVGVGNAHGSGSWLIGSAHGGVRYVRRLQENLAVYVTADAGHMSWESVSQHGPSPRDYSGLTYALGVGGLWFKKPTRAMAFEIAFRRFEGEGGFDANWVETNFVIHWGG